MSRTATSKNDSEVAEGVLDCISSLENRHKLTFG